MWFADKLGPAPGGSPQARGNILIFGSLVMAVLVPLLVHARIGRRRWWGVPAAAGKSTPEWKRSPRGPNGSPTTG